MISYEGSFGGPFFVSEKEGLLRFTPREANPLFDSLEPVVAGLGLSLVDASLSKRKGGGVHIRIVVYKNGVVGIDDCSRVHRAVTPRLDLAYPNEDFSVEVSSPGIDRLIKDASEFGLYLGRGIKCYRMDISDWTGGILQSADEKQLVLKNKNGTIALLYDVIVKAKLDYSQE